MRGVEPSVIIPGSFSPEPTSDQQAPHCGRCGRAVRLTRVRTHGDTRADGDLVSWCPAHGFDHTLVAPATAMVQSTLSVG